MCSVFEPPLYNTICWVQKGCISKGSQLIKKLFQVEEHSRKDDQIETLTSEKDQLGREIDELESAGLDLKSRLEHIIAAKFSLEQSAVADVAEKIVAIEELQKQLEIKENEFEKFKFENDAAIQELKNEIQEKSNQIEKIQIASVGSDDVTMEVQNLKEHLEQKEIEFEKIKSENETIVREMKNEIHEKENMIQQLESSSAENEEIANEARAKLVQATYEKECSMSQVLAIETSRNDLREKVESKDEQIQIHEERINQLSQDLATSHSENEDLSSKLVYLEEEKDESEKVLEQLQNRVIQMAETLEDLKAERSNFEEELLKKQTLLESLQTNSGLQDQVKTFFFSLHATSVFSGYSSSPLILHPSLSLSLYQPLYLYTAPFSSISPTFFNSVTTVGI